MVLERRTNPKLSRHTCTCEYGLQSCRGKPAGVAKRPRERSPPEIATVTFRDFCIAVCVPPLRISTPSAPPTRSQLGDSSPYGTPPSPPSPCDLPSAHTLTTACGSDHRPVSPSPHHSLPRGAGACGRRRWRAWGGWTRRPRSSWSTAAACWPGWAPCATRGCPRREGGSWAACRCTPAWRTSSSGAMTPPPETDTNCTTLSLIPTVNGNTVRSFYYARTTVRSPRKLNHGLTL
jgi:hypothetical protein